VFQVLSAANGRTQALKSIPAFFSNLLHQSDDMDQGGPGGRVVGDLVDGNVKLHGGTEHVLQECIVQFLRNTQSSAA
jgi:hypothetical protein